MLLAGAAQAGELEAGLPPSAIAANTTSASLERRMRELQVPGVSVAYVHDGKLAWVRGYGVTRVGGPAVTPDTRFQAASISKGVTAFGVLREVQTGRLDLDADVRGYLKRWRIPENAFTRGHKITLRQLLSHTAGMTVHGFPGYAADARLPTAVQLLNGESPANTPPVVADAAPGTHFSYSGGGYVIVQLVLEDVTGLSFAELMRRDVLRPLGMARSSFQLAPPRGDVATPYRMWNAPVRGGPHRYPELAPAGLWTTPGDLARFVIAIQNSRKGAPGAPLSADLARLMTSAVATPDQVDINIGGVANGYGLGLVTAEGTHPFFWHDGEDEGFLNLMTAYYDGDGLVTMTNGERGDVLNGDILRAFATAHDWPNFQPAKASGTGAPGISAYAGHYRVKNGPIFVVTADGSTLTERHIGRFTNHLLPDGEHAFQASGWNGREEAARLVFTLGPDARASSFVLDRNGHRQVADRLADNDPVVARTNALQARINNQTEGSATRAALGQLIEALAQGSLASVDGEASWKADMEGNLPFSLRNAKQMGALRAMTFRGVGSGGNDIYEVEYAHGWAIWRIGLSSAGKIRAAFYSAD